MHKTVLLVMHTEKVIYYYRTVFFCLYKSGNILFNKGIQYHASNRNVFFKFINVIIAEQDINVKYHKQCDLCDICFFVINIFEFIFLVYISYIDECCLFCDRGLYEIVDTQGDFKMFKDYWR